MKGILLFFFFISLKIFSQDICDCALDNTHYLKVLDCNNKKLAGKFLFPQEELCGFSSSIIVVKDNHNSVTVYDQDLKKISSKLLANNDVIKNIIGNKIIIKGLGNYVTTYDENFNKISGRF